MIRRQHSYFSVLFVLFLALGLFCVGLTVLAVQLRLDDGLLEYLDRSAQESLSATEGEFSRLMAELQDEVEGLAEDDAIRRYLAAAPSWDSAGPMRAIYQVYNAYDGRVNIHVVSCRSAADVSNTKTPQTWLYPYNTLDWGIFRHVNAGDYAPLADLDAQSGVSFALGRPVRSEVSGETTGYVLLEVRRELLEERLREGGANRLRKLIIADPYGLIIYNSENREQEGLSRLDTIVDASDDDQEIIRMESPSTGMIIYCQKSRELMEIVHAQVSSAIKPAVGIILLALVAAAWALSRQLRKPFAELEAAVSKVEAGDFSIRAPEEGFKEMASFSRSFNHMSSHLEALIHSIEEKQRMLRVAQVNALQLQVNPHFLYNTLDLIRWLARENKVDAVSSTVVSLAQLLRRTLDLKSDIVTVATELELVENYVGIQCMRYEDRLSCQINVAPELTSLRMPKLLLLPIVENSIIHGLENKPGEGHVHIEAERQGDYLIFHVDDDGMGMSPETLIRVSELRQDGMYGIGLTNVHKRARIFGDERCGIHIDSTLGEGTRIELTVKIIPTEEGQNV